MIEDFPEHLRPYTDKEIPAAMQRIAAHKYFPQVAEIIFPGITPEQAITKVLSVKTVCQFQMEWMYAFNQRVIQTTLESFTYHISPLIKPGTGYLYISNHRDIILDSSLLQMVLVFNNLPTSMITYGDNLLVNQLAEDIARSNKMFKVVRQGNKRELFKNSLLLSEFMRSCVRHGDSCWIAQRNGRTKDGLDKTSKALVKMMAMSGNRNDPVENYAALNIVPVSISYEYEPCDYLKTRELLLGAHGKIYKKEEGEDLNSMLTGIIQWKGKVHIHLGDPLTRDDLEPYCNEDFNSFTASLSELIDKRIYKGYKCFPSNYIAYDLLQGEVAGGGGTASDTVQIIAGSSAFSTASETPHGTAQDTSSGIAGSSVQGITCSSVHGIDSSSARGTAQDTARGFAHSITLGEHYSVQEKAAFLKRLKKITDPSLILSQKSIEGLPRIDFNKLTAEEYAKARQIFLNIYANPVCSARESPRFCAIQPIS
ncbi:MAG: 1-acyl-sn-glycerol-3-phosphate acyltransferase [Bacteroidales bacterium]|nr:1-acyl-sn-glycerol-3-phosphate acyltransferase [Bacteroidales bacterium]MDD4486812.1 1-acyl-sn-glycerol-3-phosphate acyltransferase [Proteiniphilum sp.]MDD2264579.1 1-acyl-sn-glycerol-3-phosphate acyltransferase [Bacteroidales bacterium]MDD2831813.1 1-acyl-sn-glycerol-3-phosphate acyltransferase [Bacteroidales bacterium]MDD4168065.1 1-acyl-sn-glycerol-3-phosphate acyltransferase [Bacteroidales bacterium]